MFSTPYTNTAPSGAPIVVQGREVPSNHASAPLHPVSPYQHSSTTAAPANIQRQEAPPRQCRDLIWGILFYVHLAVIVALAAVYAPELVSNMAENQNGGRRRLSDALRYLQEDEDQELDIDPQALMTLIGLAGVLGITISTLALGFLMAFAESLIKIALWCNILLFVMLGLLTLASGAGVVSALFMFAMAGFLGYYAYRVWDRIPFAASNLVTAVTAVRANLGLAVYAYWSHVVLIFWMIVWGISTVSTISATSDCNPAEDEDCDPTVSSVVTFLFFVSFYWTAQVIINVVHVTTAGVVGTWWHVPLEASGCCSQAVRDSYFRSITYSFGSICLGSLIVAIIQAVKEMVHSARENGDSLLACCAEFLIGCLERLVEYFNKWAFVYVGLYGMSFMESGYNVINLFKSRGWTTIITDALVDTVLFMVSLGVGLVTGILAVVIGAVMQLGDSASLIMAFVFGLLVGYGLCATLFSVVSSATNTVIVCYAEAPNELETNHPELSRRMRETWRQAWPNEFGY